MLLQSNVCTKRMAVLLSGLVLLVGCLKRASGQQDADGTLETGKVQEIPTETYLAFREALPDPDELVPGGVTLVDTVDNSLDDTTSVTLLDTLFLETIGDNTTSVKKSDPLVDGLSDAPSSSESYAIVEGDIMVEPEYEETATARQETGTQVQEDSNDQGSSHGSEPVVTTDTTQTAAITSSEKSPRVQESVTERQKDSDSSEEESNEVREKNKSKHCSQKGRHQHTRNHQSKHVHKLKKGGDIVTKMIQECIRDAISEHESAGGSWSEQIVKDVVNSCIDNFR